MWMDGAPIAWHVTLQWHLRVNWRIGWSPVPADREAAVVTRHCAGETVRDSRDCWVIRCVCFVANKVRRDSAIWVWITPVCRISTVLIAAHPGRIASDDGTGAVSSGRLALRVLGERCWVHR